MKKEAWKEYLIWIALSQGVGILAGLLSRSAMAAYTQQAVQPEFSPPPIVFPIVWTILYALMGIGMARVQLYGAMPGKRKATILFLMQLAINFLWPLVFFNLQAYGAALALVIVLWVLAAAMTDAFMKEDQLAGRLQLPYLLWLSFAVLLNEQVFLLNR